MIRRMELEEARARCWAAVDARWEDELEFLRQLVRRPSLRGQTNLVQRHIAERLRADGLEVHEIGIDLGRVHGLRGFSPVDWSYAGLIEVVGVRRGRGGGRSLVLNGHVDVVSPEPVGHWSHDPWGAEICEGRMYGRGAGDMKAGVAAMVAALEAVEASGMELAGDVVLQTVIDEECSGNGTLAVLAEGWRGDAAVVPEPMGMTLVSAHPGVLWCRIEVRGRGAHAQSASAAINPIDKAYLLVGALRQLEAEWNRPGRRHPALAGLDHPINFNLGTLHSGDWPSTSPELCVVEMRLAFQPGEDIGWVEETVRERVAAAAASDDWLRQEPPRLSFVGFHAEGCVYDLNTEIAAAVRSNHHALVGRPPDTRPIAATVDNRLFELAFGIPNVCYGPVAGQLHAPDEWVDLESLRTITKVLAGTLVDWCGLR
jgi:acetylornithine deacetylase